MNDAALVKSVFIEDELKKSYLAYSMSMITSRALPDVRDGLKPVHRRVLYAMRDLGLDHNKAPKKCARVCGDVTGKYHPHGESAVYDALVRMAQSFSLRYPMVNGQGNFGSIDGDPPAAMRYTEARMTRLAEEMLADLDKETVDFKPNYDESLKEPVVLPSALPHLLLNGSTGIAVGMATNMPPHNLGEVVDAITAYIENPEIDAMSLIQYIPGPDFPTGGIIYGRSGIRDAYTTGKGRVVVRARATVETTKEDREQIIITEIPYQVNKSVLLEKIADLVRQKTVEGISFIRDESDRQGMRIVIGIKKDNFGDVVLNKLYKYTTLQNTFGINSLALVNMQPRQLTLKELIKHFVDHRFEVITRRTEFELRKAKDRAHILEGLKIALDHIDEIVELIKSSSSGEEAHNKLMERFGLSDVQAKAILDMRLQRLTGLERQKIEDEFNALMARISELEEILASREMRMDIIKNDLLELKAKYGDPRKTEIVEATGDVDIEDMIADEDMVITMTRGGYIKRSQVTVYRSQARGGRGVKGMESKEDDFVESIFVASAHSYIMFFTNIGRCHWLKVYQIPEAGRQSRGRSIVNLLKLRPEEQIAAYVPVKEFDDQHFIIIATQRGVVNKQPLPAYSNVRKDGINAIHLDEGDRLISCHLTTGTNDVIIGTRNGQAVRFPESATRELGRNTRGMKGIKLRPGDLVVGMIVINEEDKILTVTQRGFGKITPVSEYRRTNRGGTGIINIKSTERNGSVVGLRAVTGDSDLMLVSRKGIIIRSPLENVSVIGRNTQGVKLMNLGKGDELIDVALCDKEEPIDEDVAVCDAVDAETETPEQEEKASDTETESTESGEESGEE